MLYGLPSGQKNGEDKKMMERDSEGYIISKLPETAKKYKNKKYLVIPEENGLPEFTPAAYNYVNSFFRNNMNVSFEIDNLNNREWYEIVSGTEIIEIKNIGRISFEKGDELFSKMLENKLTGKVKESDQKEYNENLENETVLDICISAEKGKVHIELPYCTIEKICECEKNSNFRGSI